MKDYFSDIAFNSHFKFFELIFNKCYCQLDPKIPIYVKIEDNRCKCYFCKEVYITDLNLEIIPITDILI